MLFHKKIHRNGTFTTTTFFGQWLDYTHSLPKITWDETSMIFSQIKEREKTIISRAEKEIFYGVGCVVFYSLKSLRDL